MTIIPVDLYSDLFWSGFVPKGAGLTNGPDRKGFRQLALATTIPVMMLAAPAVGYLIGKYLDDLIGTADVMTLIFLLLGLVAGGLESYNLIKRISKEDSD